MKNLFLAWLVAITMVAGSVPAVAQAATKESSQKSAQTAKKKSTLKQAKNKKQKQAKNKKKKQKQAKKTKRQLAQKKSKSARQAKAAKARQLAMAQQEAEIGSDGELALRSSAALVLDQATGELIYAKNADLATPIASITKLMTAMVTLDAELPLQEEIEIGYEDVDRLKFTSSRLPIGARLTREELLHLALIASENRAAAALSRAYPGGREAFVRAMNEKARNLGMYNTYYVDGTGLSSQNRSTAAELARLVDVAHRHYPLIREVSATGSYDVTVPGGKRMRHLAYVNTNALTRNENWNIGVSKTGYIREAGHCLVMQTQIAGQRVIIVLLDSLGKMSRIGDAARIKRWIERGGSERLATQSGRGRV